MLSFSKIFWLYFLSPAIIILVFFWITVFYIDMRIIYLIEVPWLMYVVTRIELFCKDNEFRLLDYLYIGIMLLISIILLLLPLLPMAASMGV